MLEGPSVVDLLPPSDPPGGADGPPPAVPAGVNQYAKGTKLPPALGRAADLMPPMSKQPAASTDPLPAPQPSATPARPAKNPTVTAGITIGANDAGTIVQGTVKTTYVLTPKDKINLEFGEQWLKPDTPGAPDALDHQLGASWEHLLLRASDGRFKLTSNVGAFLGVGQPLNGGDSATRFGVKGEIVGSFKPDDVLELRGSIFVQNQWSFDAAGSLFTVGGDLSAAITFPKTPVTAAIGLRGEAAMKEGAAAPLSAYALITIPINKQLSIYGQGFIGINGSGGVSPSLAWSQNSGGVGLSGGISVSF